MYIQIYEYINLYSTHICVHTVYTYMYIHIYVYTNTYMYINKTFYSSRVSACEYAKTRLQFEPKRFQLDSVWQRMQFLDAT